MLYDGEGIKEDRMEAAKLYSLAAMQGHLEAQIQLAHMHQVGVGVKKDYSIAFDLFRKASTQGSAIAQLRLGRMYSSGEGIAKNNVLAYMWLNLSAYNGQRNAKRYRDEVLEKLNSVEIDKAQEAASLCLESDYKICHL